MSNRVGVLAVLALNGIALMSCAREDCLALPCPLPLALAINVSGGTAGAPVDGAVVRVSGAAVTTIPCSTVCRVPGTAGTYNLEVTAPGFETAQRTVTVQGTTPPCGCPTVVAETVAIVLVARASHGDS
jgi:hypothetical protein